MEDSTTKTLHNPYHKLEQADLLESAVIFDIMDMIHTLYTSGVIELHDYVRYVTTLEGLNHTLYTGFQEMRQFIMDLSVVSQ